MGFLWDFAIKAIIIGVIAIILLTIFSIIPCPVLVGIFLIILILQFYSENEAQKDEN